MGVENLLQKTHMTTLLSLPQPPTPAGSRWELLQTTSARETSWLSPSLFASFLFPESIPLSSSWALYQTATCDFSLLSATIHK